MKIIIILFFLNGTTSIQPCIQFPPSSSYSSSIPDSIRKIFERSCIKCHSDGGRLMAMSHLNFSKWDSFDQAKQANKAADICKNVSIGKMPPKSVRESTPGAIPTDQEVRSICMWSKSFSTNTGK